MNNKIDIQGWIRCVTILFGVVGSAYYFAGKIDSHVSNKEIHRTTSELSDVFITRREYDSYKSMLKDDLVWIKGELARINTKLDKVGESQIK